MLDHLGRMRIQRDRLGLLDLQRQTRGIIGVPERS
jgi:hypothetical protein